MRPEKPYIDDETGTSVELTSEQANDAPLADVQGEESRTIDEQDSELPDPPQRCIDEIDVRMGLEKEKRPFITQGLRHLAIGTAALALPLLLYARVAMLTFPNESLRVLLLGSYIGFGPIIGIILLSFGSLCCFGGIAFVEWAKTLLQKPSPVTLELSAGKKPVTMDASKMYTAKLTYENGTSESFKVSGPIEGDFDSILGEPTQATMFGSPFEPSSPRVLSTSCGTLLSMPNEAGLLNALSNQLGSTKTILQNDPWCFREQSLKRNLWIYLFLFVLAYSTAEFTVTSSSWFLLAVFGTGVVVRFIDLFENRTAAKRSSRETVECSVILIKPEVKFRKSGLRARVLAVGETETQEYAVESVKVNPSQFGQPLEGRLYRNSKGKMSAIEATGLCLFEKKLRFWQYAPLVVYFACMPFLFKVPDKNVTMQCNSAQEYYAKAVEMKTYGWTEKAREAAEKAIAMDKDGPIGAKASRYLHTKIPAHPVSPEAEKLNIKGFNLTGRQPEQAKAAFRSAIEKYPEFEWPYSNLGGMLTDEGTPALAVPLLEKALQINPQYTNALRHMVDAQLKLGNRTEAKRYLDQAIATDPENFALRIQRFALECSI